MNDRWLVDERAVKSAILREASEKLNFIWRLAYAYRAPEHLLWLELVTSELADRRDFVRASLKSRRPSSVA